jgi:hypothetical protein
LSTLSSVILKDVIANLPAAGIPGRLFFATDAHEVLRDNGTSWDSVASWDSVGPSSAILGLVAVAPASGGNFTVAHGLSATPSAAAVMMTSDGGIWFQLPTLFDATNLYLTASDAGITGSAICFK